MRSISMIIGHFLWGVVFILGFIWMVTHIAVLPDYKLIIVLAALNILVLNHMRWYRLSRKSEGTDITAKVNHLLVSHYMILVLVCGMLDFNS